MNITKCTNTHNTTSKQNRKIQYIVLHYTAGTTSKSGTALSTANYFATTTRQASADFIVDDTTVVQYNPDIKNRYTWAVGGSKYSVNYTSEASKYYNKCLNNNSVSIEMCSSKVNKKSVLVSDTDWYLTDAVVNNAVELTKYLMKQYNIDIDHVIMHHHVNGKQCPQPWTINEAALSKWHAFKKRLGVSESSNTSTSTNPAPTPTPTNKLQTAKYKDSKYNKSYYVNAKSGLNMRYGAGTNYPIIKALPYNTLIRCYGYYNKDASGKVWLYVKVGTSTGYVSLEYLR